MRRFLVTCTNMLVSKIKALTEPMRTPVHPTRTPNASQWSLVRVGYMRFEFACRFHVSFHLERYNNVKYKTSPFYKGVELLYLLPMDIVHSDSLFQFKHSLKLRYNIFCDTTIWIYYPICYLWYINIIFSCFATCISLVKLLSLILHYIMLFLSIIST